jgi:hypothetical protein
MARSCGDENAYHNRRREEANLQSSGSSQSVNWLHGRHMDSNESYQRAVCSSFPYSSVDRQ